jgi:hypothetical protein
MPRTKKTDSLGTAREMTYFLRDDAGVDDLIVHFLNIFDKGYRSVLEAKRHQQQCLQPV